jgi:hypothetical protein
MLGPFFARLMLRQFQDAVAMALKLTTQLRCPSVSGTLTPRAFPIISNAASGLEPEETSTHAAISDERPIPARQWTATAFP